MATIIRNPTLSPMTRQLPRNVERSQIEAVVPFPQEVLRPVEQINRDRTENLVQPRAPDPAARIAAVELVQPAVLDIAEKLRIDNELAERRIEAEKQGYRQGFERGEIAAKSAVADQVERLVSIAASLYHSKVAIMESAEDALVEIAFAAICRVIGERASNREIIAGMVNQAISEVRERDEVFVRLHPSDLELMQQSLGSTDGLIGPHAILRADASILLGGCVVDSGNGYLDARLETQLNGLRQALLLARKERTVDAEAT